MVEIVDGSTGEVKEVDSIAEAAETMIERPPYRRRVGHLDDGDWGKEYNVAFLKAQKEIGPVIGLDSENSFNNSKYVSLGALLNKVQRVLNDNGFIVSFGTGTVKSRNEAKTQFFLPVFLTLTHAETGQWRIVGHEMPILKFDPQSFGATITYGRRYVLTAHMSIAGCEPDDDGVLASHQLTAEQLDEVAGRMRDKIQECRTEAELRKWHKDNEQGCGVLDQKRLNGVKELWQDRFKETRWKSHSPATEKSGKRMTSPPADI